MPLTIHDSLEIYRKLEKIAFTLQQTRQPWEMAVGGIRASLSALHIPVGQQTQNLDDHAAQQKLFYDAVIAERTSFLRSHGLGGSRIVATDRPISKNEQATLFGLVNYLSTRGALTPSNSRIVLSDRKKITIRHEQILSIIRTSCPDLSVSQDGHIDGAGTWSASRQEKEALQHRYAES